MALNQGAGATQSFYNLLESTVGYYYYDVNYSTCSSSGGGGGPWGEPNNQCYISAIMANLDATVTPGGYINLLATINKGSGVSIVEKDFDVFYKGVWYPESILSSPPTEQGNTYSRMNAQINVLGELKYRLRMECNCNGAASTIYSSEVSTYSQYTGSQFTTRFASEIYSAWSQTVSSTIAHPGTKYEYGFSGYFHASRRQIEVDGTITSTSAPCGTTVVGQNLPEKPTYSDVNPQYGVSFTVGNFHTHPPLTYCSSSESISPGPSSIDMNSITHYPRIVRTYNQTVQGGHNINAPTADYFINSKTVTDY